LNGNGEGQKQLRAELEKQVAEINSSLNATAIRLIIEDMPMMELLAYLSQAKIFLKTSLCLEDDCLGFEYLMVNSVKGCCIISDFATSA
jgi:trehalose-6-phosphate synthase